MVHVKIQNLGDHYELMGQDEYATLTEMVFHLMEREHIIKHKDGPTLMLKEPLCVTEPSMERYVVASVSISHYTVTQSVTFLLQLIFKVMD